MSKEVMYNREKENKYASDRTNVLEKGNIYEVRRESYVGGSAYYELYGLEGIEFNSKCFDIIHKPTCFVLARKIPERGECIENYRVFKKGKWDTILRSPKIISVHQIGIDTYEAETETGILLVQII